MLFPRSALVRKHIIDIGISVLFGVGLLVLSLASPSIPGGDDAYRHAKYASRLMADPGAAMADPWRLVYFWPKPVDAWFGYHVLLAPLTSLFGLIAAAKILAAAVFGGLVYVILRLLGALGCTWNAAWVALAVCGSGTLLSRATFARPFLFSMLLVLAATYFTLRNSPIRLMIVSALHALSYSVFFLVGLAPGLYFLIRRDRRSTRLLLISIGGILLGLAANPHFPENVRFDLAQVLTPVSQYGLDIGEESRPLSGWWILGSLPVTAIWVLALIETARRWPHVKPGPGTRIAFLASILALLGSVRIARGFDFFVLFGALFAASVLSSWITRNRRDARYVAAMVLIACVLNLGLAYYGVKNAPSILSYERVGKYLQLNGQNAVVFNTQWSQYPFLYFWNAKSSYVNGIDPTFLFMQDANRYWLWRHIADDNPSTCGQPECDSQSSISVYTAVTEGFGASYLLVEPARNPRLEAQLRAEAGFREVYRDRKVTLFSVVPESRLARR